MQCISKSLMAPLAATLIGLALAGCGSSSFEPYGSEYGGVITVDLTELSAKELLDGYQAKRFTSEQVTSAYLNKIAQYEGAYNAFTSMNALALEQAREVDRKRLRGETLGPLAGVPVVIKESMDVFGLPSTAGWAPLSKEAGGIELLPQRNAVVVQRMIDAGAIVLGKTNIPALSDDGTRANSSWAGPTYSAIDRLLAPGASSSGTATAVAGGLAAVGLAEETGGSIQNPSAAQSLIGVKPTFGLVPTAGVVPLAGSTRDVVGPIARNVTDAALVLNVLAGYNPSAPLPAHVPAGGYTSQLSVTSLRGKRIGLFGQGWHQLALSDETRALYETAIKDLEARGAVVVRDAFAGSGFAQLALAGEPYDYRGTESAVYDFNRYLMGLGISSLAELKLRAKITPFDVGAPLNWYVEALPILKASLADPTVKPDLSSFDQLRADYLRVFESVMEAQHLDAMMVPHATDKLPLLSSNDVISETSIGPMDIGGLPGITVPSGQYASNHAPFSVVFIGRRWSEAQMLGYAYDYEQATLRRVKAKLVKP